LPKSHHQPEETSTGYLRSFHRTVASAPGFTRLMFVITLVAWATTIQGFLSVSAIERLGLGNVYAGIFTTVSLAAQGIGGAIAGRLGDGITHRRALLGALVLQLTAFALIVRLASIEQFYIALALSAAASAASQIGLAGLTAKLAPVAERGAFIAVERWITLIAMALGTLAAALLADAAGYSTLFAISLVPVVVAMAILRGIK
jgi:MFS family permease